MSGLDSDRDASPVTATISSTLLNTGISAVVLGTIGYFLGYRYISWYYTAFGLSPAFFSFSPTDIIFAAWRIYLLFAILLVLASFAYILCQALTDYLVRKRGLNFVTSFYFLLLLAGIGALMYVWYQYQLATGANLELGFYIWPFAGLTLLWMSFAVGKHIHALVKMETYQGTPLVGVYKIVFPTPWLWLGIICLASIFFAAIYTSFTAYSDSKRDQGSDSRLQQATLYTTEQLNIPSGQQTSSNTWVYDDLRFLFKSDGTYFVFRTSEVIGNIPTVYAVPEKYIAEFHLRPWWYSVTGNP
jgi:hypothetical protein